MCKGNTNVLGEQSAAFSSQYTCDQESIISNTMVKTEYHDLLQVDKCQALQGACSILLPSNADVRAAVSVETLAEGTTDNDEVPTLSPSDAEDKSRKASFEDNQEEKDDWVHTSGNNLSVEHGQLSAKTPVEVLFQSSPSNEEGAIGLTCLVKDTRNIPSHTVDQMLAVNVASADDKAVLVDTIKEVQSVAVEQQSCG